MQLQIQYQHAVAWDYNVTATTTQVDQPSQQLLLSDRTVGDDRERRPGRRPPRELDDRRGQLARGADDVRLADGLERRRRHRRIHRVGSALDERRSAAVLHGGQAGSAVVEDAGEDDADHAAAEPLGGRTEHRIDRRTVPVLPRAAVERQAIAVETHVLIGRRDVDAASLERGAVGRVDGAEATGAREDARQDAGSQRR